MQQEDVLLLGLAMVENNHELIKFASVARIFIRLGFIQTLVYQRVGQCIRNGPTLLRLSDIFEK